MQSDSQAKLINPNPGLFSLPMKSPLCSWNEPHRWLAVVLFATAMGYAESAVVSYLRTMLNRLDPYQPQPLPEMNGLGGAEVVREASTIVMLASVAWLAGRNSRARFGYFLIAFGVWDIAYYVFLRPLTGWPRSVLDWDLLFLIPLPWWGPVLAPVCIALLMAAYGTWLSQCEEPVCRLAGGWWSIGAGAGGVLLALHTFMADAIGVAGQGVQALRDLLPDRFRWVQFVVALGLMTVPLAWALWTNRFSSRNRPLRFRQ